MLRADMRGLVLLFLMGGASIGYTWAEDKPRAGAAWAFALGMVLCQLLRIEVRSKDRLMASVCAYGVGYHASCLACVAMFPALSSREIGVCDEATGLPIGLLLCAGLLLVAAEAFEKGPP